MSKLERSFRTIFLNEAENRTEGDDHQEASLEMRRFQRRPYLGDLFRLFLRVGLLKFQRS